MSISNSISFVACLACFVIEFAYAILIYPEWKKLPPMKAIFAWDDNVLLALAVAFTFLGNALWMIFA